jgi:NAD(P)-dependent dehydrogenase (short-subunit alcohol dehydrogenase family)
LHEPIRRRPQAVEDDVDEALGQFAVVALHRLTSDHQGFHVRHPDVRPHRARLLRSTQQLTENGQEGRRPTAFAIRWRSAAPAIGWVRIRFDDLQWVRGYSRTGAYGQSKLANLLFTYELQRRLTGTHTSATAAHPGASRTELTRNTPPWMRPVLAPFDLIAQPADMGALPTLRAATDPGALGGQ